MFDAKVYTKIKSKIQLEKEGTELKVTFKIYDLMTGEESGPIKESILVEELEVQKTLLQYQIDSIDNLIKDIQKL